MSSTTTTSARPTSNPLADLSPFADGDEGTNLDDDSDYELEDSEYQEDADRVYEELLARIGEAAPQPRLEATRRAVELLGDPQRSYPIVHVTGTNGKTSTSRITESILRAYGLRTGLHDEPAPRARQRAHRDRRPADLEPGARRELGRHPAVPRASSTPSSSPNGEEPLTFFEALTVLAFASFADAPVDVAVIEVGMGGEWDSTNVGDGQVAVFTPIALDHTQRLGSTIAEIARTKSGIIKPAASVVSAAQDAGGPRRARARGRAHRVDPRGRGRRPSRSSRSTVAVGGQVITVRGLAGTYSDLFLPLFGDHQGHNAALAIAAVESFLGGGTQPLVGDVLAEGLATATSPGRLQIIGTEPTVLVDAAHNPHGARALAAALTSYFTSTRSRVVLGVLQDKDARGHHRGARARRRRGST